MERPSHIPFARHSSLSRTPWLGLAIAFQLAGAWLFMHGLSTGTVTIDRIIDVLPFTKTEVDPAPPPPLPPAKPIAPVKVEIPIFTTQTADPGNKGITTTEPTQRTATLTQAPPTHVERAAVAIAGTHTTPPYPPAARRLGLEGVVTLRLTVGTDGRVSAAEIVNSAGSAELDQAALDWILAHWRYRPALREGNPVPVQLLASVAYSLKNER